MTLVGDGIGVASWGLVSWCGDATGVCWSPVAMDGVEMAVAVSCWLEAVAGLGDVEAPVKGVAGSLTPDVGVAGCELAMVGLAAPGCRAGYGWAWSRGGLTAWGDEVTDTTPGWEVCPMAVIDTTPGWEACPMAVIDTPGAATGLW